MTHLLILEVSRKQAYISGNMQLPEILRRSAEAAYVTSSAYFSETAGKLYKEAEHLVCACGGYAILRFADQNTAAAFAGCVTEKALREFPELELFVKTVPYDPGRTVSENLACLAAGLEQKKNLRPASFRQGSFGGNWKPVRRPARPVPQLSDGADGIYQWMEQTDNLTAVIFVRGNAMAGRFRTICDWAGSDLNAACDRLRAFGAAVSRAFHGAYQALVQTLSGGPVCKAADTGDAVCFVTAGRLGLFCAEYFLNALAGYPTENGNGDSYAACAGIVMAPCQYPFYRACVLSRELCDEAGRFSASLDSSGQVSALDWQLVSNQPYSTLAELRCNSITEDGNALLLRPIAVSGRKKKPETWRCLDNLKKWTAGIQSLHLPPDKLRLLQQALAQGEMETAFALEQMPDVLSVLPAGLDSAFVPDSGKKRCLLSDPIELMEYALFPEEKTVEELVKGAVE